jgi:hypothetical protein
MELLIGWSLDANVPRSTLSLIADSFKKFWPAWRERLRFGIDVLNELMTDMMHITEQVIVGNQSKMPESFFLRYRCFLAITQAVCFSSFSNLNPLAGTVLDANPNFLNDFRNVLASFFKVVQMAIPHCRGRTAFSGICMLI